MPDLNSVLASPHSLNASRRRFQQHLRRPSDSSGNPDASINILSSNQNTVNQNSFSVPSPQLTASQPVQTQGAPLEVGVGSGPGPSRHPRPLTASELQAQLEKEQEAVVNRLTRELTLLRAQQNASVVSNASSTSTTASTPTHEPLTDSSLLSAAGFSIPTSRRHNRNSSSASQNPLSGGVPLGSSYEGARIYAPRPTHHNVLLSRQSSSTSRRSCANSATPPSSLDPSSYFHRQRVPPPPISAPLSSVGATPGSIPASEQFSPVMMPATSRYEETAYYRNELETAKKENDALKRRIRELEKQVRDRREPDVSRPRSESASTTASVSVQPSGGASIAPPRESMGGARIERGRERGPAASNTASSSSANGGTECRRQNSSCPMMSPNPELPYGETRVSDQC